MRILMRLPELTPFVVLACVLALLLVHRLVQAIERDTAIGWRVLGQGVFVGLLVFGMLLYAERADAFPISCQTICGGYPQWVCEILYPSCF